MTIGIREASELCGEIADEIGRGVVGQDAAITLILGAVLTDSHVLIEDLPGVGKTMLARAVATVLGCDFRRVQHTPDLLPSDLTGVNIYRQSSGEFEFVAGPIFTNVLLADEINRTPPKTQSALLEAMAERQVSVDGETRSLPDPFVVLATQNPIELEGTYPLPEAQLDRFGVRIHLGYLPLEVESRLVVDRIDTGFAEPDLKAVADPRVLAELRGAVNLVSINADLVDYAVRLTDATRHHSQLEVGASTRATLMLVAMSRASALQRGRSYVVPDDIADLVVPVLGHRVVLRPELWARQVSGDDIVAEILDTVPPPSPDRTRAG